MAKTILITGSSTGIGKATALYFAEKGWNVAATMRSPEKEKDLIDIPNIKLFKLDVSDENSIKLAIEGTISIFGAIDVLFNNAGYGLVGAFEAMSQDQIKKQFDTNVFGVMNVTRAILPHFRSRKEGIIITTSSIGGLLTFPLYSPYHATKWAVEGFMESLQYELRQFNIKVKNIEPGAIQTQFGDSLDFISNPVYDKYALKAHENMLEEYKKAPGAISVAKTVWKAANDNSFRLRYPASIQASALLIIRKILPLNWFVGIVRMVTEKGIKLN